MRPFKHPPNVLSQCSQCLHRSISTTATATSKRRKDRTVQKQISRELQGRASALRIRIREARIARREDWVLGPLAPRRETEDNDYGTVPGWETKGMTAGLARGVLTERKRGGITAAGKKKWKGKGVGMSWKESLIYEGDRVAIVSGTGPESRDLGKIGTVRLVRRTEREVLVDHLNLADIKAPPSALIYAPGSSPIRTVSLPIPLSCVRLVHAIHDPETGKTADVIISRLIPLPDEMKTQIRAEFNVGAMEVDEYKARMKSRTIPGSKGVYSDWLEIPIPDEAQEKKKKKPMVKEHESDTVRYQVEETTWTPTLLRAPMPGGVIDELRNKYSRFRTRHEANYQLMLDDRARRKAQYQDWVASGGGMMTPIQEARRREREQLKAKGEPTLEKEVLERIGEVMAERGIEMTEQRKREMERNLTKEGVVKWGPDVKLFRENAEAPAGLEEVNGDGERERAGSDEVVQDALIEDTPSEKRPPAS